MKAAGKIISILWAGILFGCAAGPSIQKESEKVTPPKEPERMTAQGGTSERYDALMEKVKGLEQSVSGLRTEVAILGYRLNEAQARRPLTTYRLPKEVSLCGEYFPLEDSNVRENMDREFLVALSNEAQVLLWMKRAKRYFPSIEKRLKEMGLPDDLKYVTITESGLRPEAVSTSGAGGIWQFIPSTGEKYGMRKNRSVDERFDFFKATEGALAYLKSLNEEFNSWTLSMAAYNAGENRVRKEIDLQKTRNYFFLELPLETKRYVYKIAAAKIILSDPGKYGYTLDEKELYNPLQVERVQIELSQPLPIMEVARATGSYYKEIKEINPHLFEETIPPGVHFLNLPPGTSEKFWAFFSAWKRAVNNR